MSIEGKYPLLIGHSDQGSQELHSIQEVADFICSQGLESDLLITQEDGSYFLNTFGIYIDRIADMEYREALLKVLIPMQMELDGTAEIDEEPSPEDERLEEVNKRLEPFELYQCGNGKYGLSLPFSFLQEPYEDYGQAAFNRFAMEHGEEAKNSFGLYTHGSGYEWEKVFQAAFQEDTGLQSIEFDSEAGGFYCYCPDAALLERMGLAFKAKIGYKARISEIGDRLGEIRQVFQKNEILPESAQMEQIKNTLSLSVDCLRLYAYVEREQLEMQRRESSCQNESLSMAMQQ